MSEHDAGALGRAVIAWKTGGEAALVAAAGAQVTVRSTRPFPPGAPVDGALTVEPRLPFTLKVSNARKVAEGVWEVRGRLTEGTSALRAALAAIVAAAGNAGTSGG